MNTVKDALAQETASNLGGYTARRKGRYDRAASRRRRDHVQGCRSSPRIEF